MSPCGKHHLDGNATCNGNEVTVGDHALKCTLIPVPCGYMVKPHAVVWCVFCLMHRCDPSGLVEKPY
jgi:hypothetical protein